MAKQLLFSFELTPGMMVYEDVLDDNGRVHLHKGQILDAKTIANLEFYSITEIPIEDDPNHKKPEEPPKKDILPPKKGVVRAEKMEEQAALVRDWEEYKNFVAHYSYLLNHLHKTLDRLVAYHDPVDQSTLLIEFNDLLNDCHNANQLFNILNNLAPTDDQTYHHSINVALISVTLGRWLGLSDADCITLTIAALLHDVGKITISDKILNKSGKLTDEEFRIVKSHVNNGYQVLMTQKGLDRRIVEAALLHHERCDGSGYPLRVQGDKISPFAKIIAIADVYDAMTCPRPYRKSKHPFEVIRILTEDGLSKYDPQYILTFMKNLASSYIGNMVQLSDQRVGEIVMINETYLYAPIVKCGDSFVDLSKEKALKIEAIV